MHKYSNVTIMSHVFMFNLEGATFIKANHSIYDNLKIPTTIGEIDFTHILLEPLPWKIRILKHYELPQIIQSSLKVFIEI